MPELRNVAGSFYREMEKLANTMHEPLVLSSWMYSFELAAFTDINKPEINMQINMNYIRAINPRLPLKQVLNQIWKTSNYQEKLSICSILLQPLWPGNLLPCSYFQALCFGFGHLQGHTVDGRFVSFAKNRRWNMELFAGLL